jgi:AAA15 family ATPase/GTPase
MICNIRIGNVFVFSDEVELSLKANMKYKKFGYNIYSENNFNILKSIGIYGPNNVGKTCLLKSIRNIKNIILGQVNTLRANLFSDNNIMDLGIAFLESGGKYSYNFKYNGDSKEFIFEEFVQIYRDDYGNEKIKRLFLRDSINKEYYFPDKEIENIMKLTSKSNIFIQLIDETENIEYKRIKSILLSFANKIDYIDMNNIPMEKTIDMLKNKNKLQEKIANFIINADLDMEGFKYVEDSNLESELSEIAGEKAEEKVLNIPKHLLDQVRLTSIYKGKAVPSMLFDSTGTKKIAALSSYIIEALEEGRILIVDELDSSIHFKLARAIVSMFNNELNKSAQLIFSVHDINLMDCKKLFRKEQIWFIHKDDSGVYLYSLADFTAEDGIRSSTDIIEKYKKGVIGSVPNPNLINTLLEVDKDE